MLSIALSIILAIPLAIAANLLTPKFANMFASRSGHRATKRVKALRREIEEAERFHDDRQLLHLRLSGIFLVTTGIGAVGSALAAALSAGAEVIEVGLRTHPYEYSLVPIDSYFLAANVASATSAVLVAAFATRGIRLLRREQNFETYRKETTALIERLSAKHLKHD